jgi:hypothetical protein
MKKTWPSCVRLCSFSPSGDDVLSHYFDDRGIVLGVTTGDIAIARARFDESSLFYAKKTLNLNELDSVTLTPGFTEDEITHQADRVHIVAVLVTGDSR